MEKRAARHGVSLARSRPNRRSSKPNSRSYECAARSPSPRRLRPPPAVTPPSCRCDQPSSGRPLGRGWRTIVPEASRTAVIQHRTDPASFGRPAGVSLLVADVIGGVLGSGAEQASKARARSGSCLKCPDWLRRLSLFRFRARRRAGLGYALKNAYTSGDQDSIRRMIEDWCRRAVTS